MKVNEIHAEHADQYGGRLVQAKTMHIEEYPQICQCILDRYL